MTSRALSQQLTSVWMMMIQVRGREFLSLEGKPSPSVVCSPVFPFDYKAMQRVVPFVHTQYTVNNQQHMFATTRVHFQSSQGLTGSRRR